MMLAIQQIILNINIRKPKKQIQMLIFFSCLKLPSTDNISFIDENEENKLKATRIAKVKRLMIGHVNIISIRNKFEMLSNSIH